MFHSLIRIRIRPDPQTRPLPGKDPGHCFQDAKKPTLAVLQPTYISSWGLVMCRGCAAAAPTGAAVTGVVLLLKNMLILKRHFKLSEVAPQQLMTICSVYHLTLIEEVFAFVILIC
jgi:hypothetical protein